MFLSLARRDVSQSCCGASASASILQSRCRSKRRLCFETLSLKRYPALSADFDTLSTRLPICEKDGDLENDL
jgi:hypothetical protein